MTIGILFAFGALFGWGIGDFLSSRITRDIGTWKTRIFINVIGSIVLFPFAAPDVVLLWQKPENIFLLVGVSLTVLFGGYYNFRALKVGKLALVETVTGMELPLTVLLSMMLLHERPSAEQLLLIGVIFIGVLLAVHAGPLRQGKSGFKFEGGTMYLGLAVVGLSLMNVSIGVASRQVSPSLVAWFVSIFILCISLAFVGGRGKLLTLVGDLRRDPVRIISLSLAYNAAFLCFGFAATMIPVSIVTSISEGYVILGSLLGVLVYRERFRPHQVIGIVIAITGIMILASQSH